MSCRHGDHDKVDSMLKENDFEHRTLFRVHLASWLLQLGLSYGLSMTLSRSRQGGKQTLDMYRAVPDDSEIFKHCQNGNLREVKILLSMGKASVWDRDKYRRTPQHGSSHSYSGPIKAIRSEGWSSSISSLPLYSLPAAATAT